MTTKTYQAPSMAEALAAVKKDLGRDAVILHTRSFRTGGLLRLIGARRVWEVTASPHVNVPPRLPKGRYVAAEAAQAVRTQRDSQREDLPEAEPGPSPTEQLANEMSHVRRMVETLVHGTARDKPASDEPPELAQYRKRLLAQDVATPVVDQLIQELRMKLTGGQLADSRVAAQALRELIVSRLATVEADAAGHDRQRGRVIALIGPTGVGKTTTIAKLAANFKLHEGRRVGLVTIDTYRVAAVDQLRTYADIIDVPLRAILTVHELRQAIHSLRDLDVVLIDTAGRSQNNSLRLNQLRCFLGAAEADEVHLVVSSAASPRSQASVLKRFGTLGVNRVIMTKLDEAETFGSLLNVAADKRGPMSYVTTGQEVPNDIAPARAEQMADWILKGTLHGH